MKKRIIVLAISSLFIIGSAFIVTKKDNIKAQNNTSNMSKNNYKNDGNLSAHRYSFQVRHFCYFFNKLPQKNCPSDRATHC